VPSPEGQSGGLFAAGRAADPRGPWLRSELCCLRPSSLTTTPSARLAGTGRFHGVSAYTPRLRCAGAPRRPARRSLLSLPCCPDVPRTLRRWVRRPPPVVLGRPIAGFLALGPSRHPQSRLCQQSPAGAYNGAASFALCCGPPVCLALRAGSDAESLHGSPCLLRTLSPSLLSPGLAARG